MRARQLKPGLFKNEILGNLDPLCVLLFQGLWLMADREGRLEDRPIRIRAELFPYRDRVTTKRVDDMLDTLKGHGFIERYEINTSRLIQVVGFKKHQNPHKAERESVLPPNQTVRSDSHSANTVQAQDEHSEKTEAVGLTPSSLTPDSLTPSSPQSGAAHLPAAKKATDVAARRRRESDVLWPQVKAALRDADARKPFGEGTDVYRVIGEMGGWRVLGALPASLIGQTEQRFKNTYVALKEAS